MPEDLKKIMSRQASAEREKRANITKAEGDKLAAENLARPLRLLKRFLMEPRACVTSADAGKPMAVEMPIVATE